MLEHFEEEGTPVIVTKYYSERDLITYAVDNDISSFTERQAKSLMLQLAKGLSQMHKRRVVHRDLKLNNIMLEKRGGEMRAVIGDFGASAKLDEGERC